MVSRPFCSYANLYFSTISITTQDQGKRGLYQNKANPRHRTQLKARLLTEQLNNDLFLRLHYSVHYFRLAILPFVILTLFLKYVFPSQICAIPF